MRTGIWKIAAAFNDRIRKAKPAHQSVTIRSRARTSAKTPRSSSGLPLTSIPAISPIGIRNAVTRAPRTSAASAYPATSGQRELVASIILRANPLSKSSAIASPVCMPATEAAWRRM